MLTRKALQINRSDYCELPQGPPYYQVVEGDLLMSPSPNSVHQLIGDEDDVWLVNIDF